MRDFSKINPSVWGSKRFKSLDTDSKLFYLYCLSSPQSNSCGCYRLPVGYAVEDLNWDREKVRYCIDTVSKSTLIQYDASEDVIYIDRWYEFNSPNNPKHCLKIINELSAIPSCALRDKNAEHLYSFISKTTWDKSNVLSKLKPLIDTVSDTVNQVGDTKTETETETETKTDSRGTSPQGDENWEAVEIAFFVYNQMAERTGLPIAQVLSERRKSNLKQRLKDAGGIEGWKIAMEKAEKSDWITGRSKEGWKASLDFFLQQSSFIKLMEGTYDNKIGQNRTEQTRKQLREWTEEEDRMDG